MTKRRSSKAFKLGETGRRKGLGRPARSGPICLVTGACGFIGSHMVEVLHDRGFRVRATDLPAAYGSDDRSRRYFPTVVKERDVEFVPSDMTRPETLRDAVRDVSYVYHIAAVFSYSAPWETLKRVNVEGTEALCAFLLEERRFRKLVLWGAGGVYGFPPPQFLPIREEDPKAPPNDYLRSKHRQEQLVIRMGRERGLRYSIVRPTGVYGPRCTYGMGQVLFGLVKGRRIAVPRNLTMHVPLVHVRDVCTAAEFLARTRASDGQAYNLNDDTRMSIVEFARCVGQILDKPVTVLPPVPITALRLLLTGLALLLETLPRGISKGLPSLERDTIAFLGRDVTYSNEKLKKLGYTFLYPDAQTGLRETIEWYRQNGWI